MRSEVIRGGRGLAWPNELRGALDYAVSTFMQRDATVTYYAHADTDRIEGGRVQLTNADQSRATVAADTLEYVRRAGG